jgi:hypothetical protein
MIPNTQLRLVSSSPIAESAEFGISMNDTAHIMQILRDQLYSDKVLAVLREYGSNAWDAHRDANKPDLPIKVTLPTVTEPTLTIRDFGLGLSPDGVFQIYTQYGASTKRHSDNSVGMLGIGSKSGFAYSDSFTVTSYNGGSKRTYVAVLDKSEKGLINLLCEEACGDETGVEISIAVRPEDIGEFHRKAQGLYQYFVPRPDINVELPKLPPAQATLKHGVIYEREQGYYSNRSWVAVMGCVSYRIDLNQVKEIDSTTEGGAAEFLSDLSGALYFGMGAVQVSASREELKYSTETKLAIVKKFNDLVEEYVRQTLDVIENGGYTFWEKRVRSQVLVNLRLPVPKASKALMQGVISVKDLKHDSFLLVQNRTTVAGIAVNANTRFVLVDDRRAIAGFEGLTASDYYVRPTKEAEWPEIEKELEALIQKVDIVGIPTIKLSSLPWHAPTHVGGRKVNAKHRVKLFKFNAEGGYSKPFSDAWDPVEHEPTVDDVFVIINNFRTKDFDIGQYYREDDDLAKAFKGELPTIYAYKTTETKPVYPKDCLGTSYEIWRDTFVAGLVTPDVRARLEQWQWARLIGSGRYYYRSSDVTKKIISTIVGALGATHLIPELLQKHEDAKLFFEKNEHVERGISILERRLPDLIKGTAPAAALGVIYAKYPLLKIADTSMSVLWGEYSAEWLNYINLVDKP